MSTALAGLTAGSTTGGDSHYTKLERVGRGSYGEVYKGINNATGELVAIKVLDLDASDDDLEEMRKELAVLSACDSEYITRYHSSVLVGSKLWIVMDYAGAGSIRRLMKAGPIPERHIPIIVREVLHALVYLHSNKIIHRDIKAANILLTDYGRVKLCDFGVAVTMSSLKRNSFVGTPYWMAPEVIRRSTYDYKADIWSLGVTVYEMAMGNPPYADHEPMKAIFLIPRNPPSRLEGSFSKTLKEFVATCLNDDAQARPAAEELIKDRLFKSLRKGTGELVELIHRHADWRAKHDSDSEAEQGGSDAFELENELDAASGGNADDAWVFDTLRPSTAIPVNTSAANTATGTVRFSPSKTHASPIPAALNDSTLRATVTAPTPLSATSSQHRHALSSEYKKDIERHRTSVALSPKSAAIALAAGVLAESAMSPDDHKPLVEITGGANSLLESTHPFSAHDEVPLVDLLQRLQAPSGDRPKSAASLSSADRPSSSSAVERPKSAASSKTQHVHNIDTSVATAPSVVHPAIASVSSSSTVVHTTDLATGHDAYPIRPQRTDTDSTNASQSTTTSSAVAVVARAMLAQQSIGTGSVRSDDGNSTLKATRGSLKKSPSRTMPWSLSSNQQQHFRPPRVDKVGTDKTLLFDEFDMLLEQSLLWTELLTSVLQQAPLELRSAEGGEHVHGRSAEDALRPELS